MDAPANALDGVRTLVMERGLLAGDRLPAEREIATALGVSRPSLRQALRQLVELGVLEPRVGAGTFLVGVDVAHLMEVRRALEPIAAGRAAEHADATLVAELCHLVARMDRALDRPHEFAALDATVHRLLAEYSGNPVLRACLNDVEAMALFGRTRTVGSPAVRARTLAEIHVLVDCVADGRATDASAAMAAHLTSIAGAARDAS